MKALPDHATPAALGRDRCDGRGLACALWLALLPFLLFWRLTLGLRVFADEDLLAFNYPILHVVAQLWREGQVPLWNPYIFGGTPLLAAMQGGVFYPLNVILLLITPFWLAYSYSILLHYSLCGIFAFLYLRSLDLSRAGAVVGALVYMFGGFTMAHLGHVGMLRTVPWLPLILWSFEVWRRRGSAPHLALGAVAIALMLVAGHPQIPFYALVITASYALWFAVGAPPPERRRALAGLLLMVMAGAAIAGVQLFPTAFALHDDYVRDGGGTYDYFTMHSFPPTHLVNLLFPRLLPMPLVEMSGYVGIASLVLAFVGGLAPGGAPNRYRGYFVMLAAVSLFLVLGRHNPFYSVLYHVPFYNSFRIPSRHWFEFTLAVAMLTAMGLDSLRHGAERALRALRYALVGIGLAVIGAVAFTGMGTSNLGRLAVTSRLPVMTATLLLLGSVAIRLRIARSPTFGVALAVLVVADLVSFGGTLYAQYDPGVYASPPDVLRFLRGQSGPFRVLTLCGPRPIDDSKESLAPDYNAAVGIESLGGYDVLMLRQIGAASGDVVGTSGVIQSLRRVKPFMDLMNTRFILVPRAAACRALSSPRYREVFRNERVVVYENLRAFPRFFWVPQVRQADHGDALRALNSGRWREDVFEPDRVALVEVPPGVPVPGPALENPPAAAGDRLRPHVEVLEMKPGDARVHVESEVDGLLVHGSNMASGWTATLDGAPAPVYRTNGFLQGVIVPAGSHVVRFRYRPVSFTLGAATSLAGLALVGAILVRPRLLRWAGAEVRSAHQSR